MKNFFLLLLLSIGLSICTSNVFAQTDAATNAIIQKKHKIFVRADFGGYNLSFYPDGGGSGGLYSGVHTALTVGYCLTDKMRLGIGGEALTEGYLGTDGGSDGFTCLPAYASFEYGDHSKRASPFYDVNAGYAFITSVQGTLNGNNFRNFTDGPFVEFMPGISFGSRQSPNRWRLGVGTQLQYTTVSYHQYIPVDAGPESYGRYDAQTGIYSYHTFITRLVFEVGVDF